MSSVSSPKKKPPLDADRVGVEALAEAMRLSFRLLRFLMVAFFVGYLATGIYVVQQHEKALVLHFGKVSGLGADRVKEPGLHWTWPRPISEVVKVPTERVITLSSDVFWVDEGTGDRPASMGERLIPGRDGYTLSGDANLLHSQWALRYTVRDAERYVLQWADSGEVLDHGFHQSIVRVSAGSAIDGMLRTDIETFRAEVERGLRVWVDAVDLGIQVQGVDVVATAPPLQVGEAFLQVIRTEQEKFQVISDAKTYATTSLNTARGDAQRVVALGGAEKNQIVQEVKSNVDYFKQVRAKYEDNPRIVAQVLLQDTLRRTLHNLDEKYVVDSGDQEIRITVSSELARKNRGEK